MDRGGYGGGRGRRGGGARRRGGDRPPPQHAEGDVPRGGGGRRAGGGGQRSRGWRGGPPRGGRGGPPHPERGRVDQDDPETRGEDGQEEEESAGYGFSRRKVVSNWNRYEDAEKEAQKESVEVQRGTDYNVLLSSAGDSFAQFRFADEKEWDADQSGPKQASPLCVDWQSLVLALQELPLYLRVNVDAELVQEETPLELPQMKPKAIEDGKTATPKFGMPLFAGASLPVAKAAREDVLHIVPLASGPGTPSPAAPGIPSILQQDTASLDQELDLLLNLGEPLKEEKATACMRVPDSPIPDTALTVEDAESDEVPRASHLPPQGDALEEDKMATSTEQATATPKMSEKDLEDWLDSLIL
ncbi:cell death regulator Aven [Ambystoma mexicanum]|uniref:cell death regulator Aven n=1 Tax=Ambystoma mexicanum TaxID=8296 RepID=UPI0037E82397